MDARIYASAPAVVVTADSELLDQVLAVAAAAGVEPQVVSDVGSLRAVWAAASMVIVGVDQAPSLANLVLPRRPDIYVVGDDATRDAVCTWSVPLGAAVVLLPGGANRLTTVMADATGPTAGRGQVVAVVGGSGGAGASTCAAALAFAGAQRGLTTMLVDADTRGGGIDLLVGAERVSGWRWDRLSSARGHLGDLAQHLPQVDGVDVLSMARGGHSAEQTPDAEQMTAVLVSAVRTHDLVVVDVPRELGSAGRDALRRADLTVLVVVGSLRGIAAAQHMVSLLADMCTTLGAVVRDARPRSLSGDAVADGLGLALLGSVADDPALRLGAERGDPPGRSARSPLARACRDVLDKVSLTGKAA